VIQVCADLEAFSREAAAFIVEQANSAIRARGRFSFVLSGGETPKRTYELLAESIDMPWARTHVFWGDERCVPATDGRSNYRMACEVMLKRVPIPKEQIYRIDCGQGAAVACREYESVLRGFFEGGVPSFDLILLGLGADGHTASLFPGAGFALGSEKWVIETTSPGAPLSRVSFTPELINQAREIIFLVNGTAKASILKRVLKVTEPLDRLPASAIVPVVGRLTWMVDRGAASLLESV
jgi:6-phosphogluconolactonase